MIYSGILHADSIRKLFEFDENAEYNLSFMNNGELTFPRRIKGFELSEQINLLGCEGCVGHLEEIK